MSSTTLTIEPYARLITMLGDQLIKNETIALIELIKNSYDADAAWVKVSFLDFGDDFSLTPSSRIVIEDDGCGMDEEILRKHWANPATPEKLKRKQTNPRTQKGRILQGEKGIGRFAIFKLGRKIKIISRRQMQMNGIFIPEGEPEENILTYDFSKYDDDFLSENGENKNIFLKNLQIELEVRSPERIIKEKNRKPYGTIIEICELKSKWSDSKINRIQKDIGKLQPIFKLIESNEDSEAEFSVLIYKNNEPHPAQERYKEKLVNCLKNKPVFKIENGAFSAQKQEFRFTINNQLQVLNFSDRDLCGMTQFKNDFHNWPKYQVACGDFQFEFYIFDLNIKLEDDPNYALDDEERDIVKEHRIYLYRDGIRVMPYGDTDDDWLGLDMARGTISASGFFSNDQVVGCVYITQEENPELKDKTNREGLIEMGQAAEDFKHVLQLFLRYGRVRLYKKYLEEKHEQEKKRKLERGKVLDLLNSLKKEVSPNSKAGSLVEKTDKAYRKEVDIYTSRLDRVENLAAVGLSVETAAHDVMLIIRKVIDQVDSMILNFKMGKVVNKEDSLAQLKTIRNYADILELQLKDIRMLFPSAKKRTKKIQVKEVVDKVYRLYKQALERNHVEFHMATFGESLIAKTTDAVLLQVFVNLFDNALYWLKTNSDVSQRVVNILIDGNAKKMIFSDSGPGIKEEEMPYIFDAFYSGKGEEGKGLGLYIAKQLLERYDYSIRLANISDEKRLKGANFVIDFAKEGELDG